MPETTLFPEIGTAPTPPASPVVSRRRRFLALLMVLSVSFLHFIATAIYYLFHADQAVQRYHSQMGVLVALIAELTSLSVLWFVLSEHKRSWAEIGWTPGWMDLIHGVGLIIAMHMAVGIVMVLFQGIFRNYTGHYLQARSIHGVIGAGISFWTVLFVVVNPFFEELIVRGYTMTEIVGLGGSRGLAIFLSVSVQMSYHVYQGVLRCIGLTVIFLVFSLYFSRTRRIAPVVLAHFWSDAWALFRLPY